MGAYIEGRAVELEAAVALSAELVSRARLPLIAGLTADMAGAGAALTLARRAGGVVDHWASDGLMREMRLLKDVGGFSTTPGEARSRADTVVIIGRAPYETCAETLHHVLAGEGALPSPGGLARTLVLLGAGSDVPDHWQSVVVTSDEVPCIVQIALLGARLQGRDVARDSLDPAFVERLDAAADRLKEAGFAVIVYCPDELDDPALLAIRDMAKNLNRDTRCSCLPLYAAAEIAGVNQACAWATGFPLRTGFARGAVEHDPWAFDAKRLLESGEADVLVWIAALGNVPLPSTEAPAIQLCQAGRAAPQAQVAIEVGTPGRDHAGAWYDAKTGRVAAFEAQSDEADPELPPAADVLARIANHLQEQDAARADQA